MAAMPKRFRTFLIGVGIFGIGDFSPSLLILLTTHELKPHIELLKSFGVSTLLLPSAVTEGAIIALILTAWRNLVQALASFPAGWLGDRDRHHSILIIGYLIGTFTMLWFLGVSDGRENVIGLCFYVFASAGIYMAIQETCEPAIVPELVPDKQLQGTAFGLLAAVNGYGDVIASLTVGFMVYQFGWTVALIYAASMMALGTIWMIAMAVTDRSATTSV
jgi:MFS family permease